MLSANILMMKATSFIHSKLNHLFGTRGKADLARNDPPATSNDIFNGDAHLLRKAKSSLKRLQTQETANLDTHSQHVLAWTQIYLSISYQYRKGRDFPWNWGRMICYRSIILCC